MPSRTVRPDCIASRVCSSRPPLGEAEWRGGAGVGGGWAWSDRDGELERAGQGTHRHCGNLRDQRLGEAPPTPLGSAESALPATRCARGGREVAAPRTVRFERLLLRRSPPPCGEG